jgi:hypothetical protein
MKFLIEVDKRFNKKFLKQIIIDKIIKKET